MSKGLGTNQVEVMKFITSEWKSTGEIAADYGITASDKTQYRSLIASLDGLQSCGHIAKDHKINDNGRVISMWRMINAPAMAAEKPKPSKTPTKSPPVATKPAPSKTAPRRIIMRGDAPPPKAPPDRITRSKD